MNLTLVVGPPNAGRAGVILRGFTDALAAQPILVVPTGDDIARFERELCERHGTVVGGSVVSFNRLFGIVATATGAEARPLLTAAQRRRLIARAVRRVELGQLRATSRHPGFVAGLDELFADMQTAAVNPTAGVPQPREGESDRDRPYLEELLSLLDTYATARDELGWGDELWRNAAAIEQLKAAPDRWGSRPVFIYGFDDLDPQQLRLVAALAASAPVTVSVSFEGRDAMSARATLLTRLTELAGEGGPELIELAPTRTHTDSASLFHLERSFAQPIPATESNDGCVSLIESGGARGEVEQVTAGVARALAAGVAPEQIAIVVRSPARYATLYQQALGQAGIPHAIHAKLPITQTAIGVAILALLRAASGKGEVADLLSFLRYPGLMPPGQVDWLERCCRRERITDIDTALAEHWSGRDIWELDNLRGGASGAAVCEGIARTARDISAWRMKGSAPRIDPSQMTELRAAQQIATEATELAALGADAPGVVELGELLAESAVSLHRASAAGRVQVLDPYRLRAGRFSHVFVAALQENEFPSAGAGSPFLSDQQRARLGMAARAEPEAEERYLFYVCLAAPTSALVLSSRFADEAGKAESRSPFIEEVCELLDPEPEPQRRDPATVVPDPADATHPRALARSLAVLPGGPDAAEAAVARIAIPAEGTASWIPELIASAAARARAPRPKDLSHPMVLEHLRSISSGGASTLEEYATCSYKWFVSHELDPSSTSPDAENMTQGSALHATLERLFRDPPGDEPKPGPETVGAWIERGRTLLEQAVTEVGLEPADGNRVAGLAAMQLKLENYLRRESRRSWDLDPDPDLLEFSFGPDEDHPGPEIVPGFELRGRIDRVDVGVIDGEPVALIRDYKSGTNVATRAKMAEERKLQLPLYGLAMQEALGHRFIAGLYEPLGGKIADKPRGLISASAVAGPVPAGELTGPDCTDTDQQFDQEVEEARRVAAEVVDEMRAGKIDRNPIGGECPRYCSFQAVCRRERSIQIDDEEGGE